jgi:mono/diheme cytochrome c family protein
VSRNDVILGVFALALVLFSLVVALVVPRRHPNFPGGNLRLFALVAALLVVAMLTAVEVTGETHHFEAAGEEQTQPSGAGTEEAKGDPAAGKELFKSKLCATCHTLKAAGSTAQVGPNLDEGLKGKDAAFIRESIVNPDAQVTEGYPDNLMPEDFGEQLSDQELADLVAFLVKSTKG